MKTFIYFQPEYVGKFKCDGQFCNAHCCKDWRIDIDKNTYKKYANIKPKAKAKEIIKKIKYNEQRKEYCIELDEKRCCPFLTEDNWCSIQKTYGSDYLSNICTRYPRQAVYVDDFYECSLSLTCPVAAELILMSTTPMVFEQTEVPQKKHLVNVIGSVWSPALPKSFTGCFIHVQYGAISILQERSLTLDQRLIVLGFFFLQLEELIDKNKFADIEMLSLFYTSEEFLKTQVPILIESIKFKAKDYIKIIFSMFDSLYAEGFTEHEMIYVNFLINALKIEVDQNGDASINDMVNNYNNMSAAREKFLSQYSVIFEHYLVQEFFGGVYPWRFKQSIHHNYGVFLITYKILELFATSMYSLTTMSDNESDDVANKKQIIKLISWFSSKINHSLDYTSCISKNLENKDILMIMRSMLQG